MNKSINNLNAYKQKILKSINRSNDSELEENGMKSDEINYKSDERGRSRGGSNSRFAKKSWQDLKEELISEKRDSSRISQPSQMNISNVL